ncbi:unnamed protein product [Paramecium pentaurelia]|uniref:Uncharacterized protein n=1 Tax=Paramecium pentaurelia TaxID=43138 RepID=A0A8S1TPW8_9CILI|nr:unnamed protein product [Paramecium pentaurelia]
MIKGYQIVPYSSLFIDMQYRHLFHTLWTYLNPLYQNKYLRKKCCSKSSLLQIEEIWLGKLKNYKILITLCIKAFKDLVLQVNLILVSMRSEVIKKGICIPEMIQIIRLNIPVEVTPDTLGCKLNQFKQFIQKKYQFCTYKTKGIMISQVFGAKFDASEIIDQVKSKGLFILEDEAQSFQIQMLTFLFFFCSLKNCSSFGGSISVYYNNDVLFRKMKALQESYPNDLKESKVYIKFQLYQKDFNKFNQYDIVKYQKNKQKFKIGLYQYFSKLRQQRICCQQYKWFQKESIRYSLNLKIQNNEQVQAFLNKEVCLYDKKVSIYQTYKYMQLNIEGSGILILLKDKFRQYPVMVPKLEMTNKILNARGIDAYIGVKQL